MRFNWNYGKREINWQLPLIGENSASYLGLPISISQFFTQQSFSCWKVLLRRVTSMSLVHVIAYRKHTLHLCRLLYIFLIWLFSASFQSKQVAKNQRVNFSHPCESVPNPELTVLFFFWKKCTGEKQWMILTECFWEKDLVCCWNIKKSHRMFYSKVPKSSHGAQVSWMIWRSLGKVNDSNCGDWGGKVRARSVERKQWNICVW